MNIKWAYYVIVVIYVILVILRGINYLDLKAYEKETSDMKKAFFIKRDFFTTVSKICIAVTAAINIAAVAGGRDLNTSSIIVTCLVLGATMLNGFQLISFSNTDQTMFLLGYTLKDGDIEKVKNKVQHSRNVINVTFSHEIDSYNYAKLIVYGKNKDQVASLFQKLQKTNKEDE